jgi:hypothetical protein
VHVDLPDQSGRSDDQPDVGDIRAKGITDGQIAYAF